MSLFIRYKNEYKNNSKILTMDHHVAVFRDRLQVLWGQFSTDKNLISRKRLESLKNSTDRRVVLYENTGNRVFVAWLDDIFYPYEMEQKQYSSDLVPEYYRLEASEPDQVSVWFLLSHLEEITDTSSYLKHITVTSSGKNIRKSLNGQGSRFYVTNDNKEFVSEVKQEFQQIEDFGYVYTEENKKVYRNLRQAIRQNQSQFRSQLLDNYQRKCAISGCDILEVLEAAHVCPYNGKESNHITNGILLRSDLHKLWDAYLLAIDPSTNKVQVASSVLEQYGVFHDIEVFKDVDVEKRPKENLLMEQFKKFLVQISPDETQPD
ncbi:HNH endonuclease [Streptococcus suis]|nr:HNH endonuclease [Streptococcus suis]